MTSEMTLADALTLYKNRVSVHKKSHKQESYKIEQIRRHPISARTLRSISTVDIAAYRDERLLVVNPKTKKRLAPATVRLEMALLSNLFEIAMIEWGACDENPVLKVRKPRPAPGRERRITNREERLMLQYAADLSNQDLYSIIVFALETAMRQNEILTLTWDNINLRTSVAHLPDTKNGSSRDVPLSVRAIEALLKVGRRPTGKIFGYTSAGLKSTWRTAMQRLDIKDLHFHDLRHEAISRLFELGSLDIMEVAAISGHKSLSMLKRYTHLKAHKLVRKLIGNRNKVRQVVLSSLIPYPARLQSTPDSYQIDFLDWEGLSVSHSSLPGVLERAQNALLRGIIVALRDGASLPQPHESLAASRDDNIVLIEPLA